MRWSAGWRDDEGAWRTHTTVGWTMDGEPASGRRGEVETEPISRERKHAARLLLLDNGACSAGTHESQPSSTHACRDEMPCGSSLPFILRNRNGGGRRSRQPLDGADLALLLHYETLVHDTNTLL